MHKLEEIFSSNNQLVECLNTDEMNMLRGGTDTQQEVGCGNGSKCKNGTGCAKGSGCKKGGLGIAEEGQLPVW